MRQVGRLGAACSAVLVTALLALSAQASAATTPEWFECVKQAGGAYQKFCGSEGGKGGYVARAGVGSGSLSARGANVTFGGARNRMTCAVKLEGTEQLPNRLASVTLVVKGCHREGETKQHCALQEEKEGAKEKSFESEPLEGELGYISRSPLKVGLKLVPVSGPNGLLFSRLYCAGPPEHFLLRGSFVAEVGGAVNVSKKNMTLNYVPGHYLGESEPEVDPPLEGEEAGSFIEEIHTTGEEFGSPAPAAVSGIQGVAGTHMIRA